MNMKIMFREQCVDDILPVIRPKLPLILSGELAISMTNARHDTLGLQVLNDT